jgi:cytosine-specific methyltransferase
LREAAIFQTFPKKYKFVENENEISTTKVARYIGNAVPVRL